MALDDFGFTSFQDFFVRGAQSSGTIARTKLARSFFRKVALKAKTSPEKIMRDKKANFRETPRVGQMYAMFYDPKHKKTLPYYDQFPLIFPIKNSTDHFIGLNLHYLPPRLRAKLMDALYSTINNKRLDETTRLRISYSILEGSSKYRAFRPCIKKYLKRHMRSRLLYIEPTDWDIVMFLPLARFRKASQQKVWSDSRQMI